MKSNYKTLGQYIRPIDVRNTDGQETNLLGVSVQKKFIPSIANTVGTDFTKYKVVKKRQFTYFEVTDSEKLLPEYLMLWFMRPEFDRYARYKSHGSVREIFSWDEMCAVELPVPDIEKQREIVKAYRTITDRIALKQRINENLEAQANIIFKKLVQHEEPNAVIEESKKAVAKLEVIIGDPYRLRAVAEDFIEHYETRVAEGVAVAGKAMFVCSNRNIAYRFYKIIKELRPEWTKKALP